jgi:hypothetical protein
MLRLQVDDPGADAYTGGVQDVHVELIARPLGASSAGASAAIILLLL